MTDVVGRPVVIRLTPGNASDIGMAEPLIAAAGRMKRLLADKGYDANALRKSLKAQVTQPVIPGRRNRKKTIRYDKERYKGRWLVEAAFCRMKDFRRVATRYDKLAINFMSAVALATIVAFWS